jgi:1,4-dihydroxy-2-naphthoyl-CoA synthase
MKDKECAFFCMPSVSRGKSHTVRYSIDSDVYKNKFLENWSLMSAVRKPIIAAVSGYAVWPWILSPDGQD